MEIDITAPYYNLSPEVIMDAVEHLGFKCSGSLLALNSYENRVYQLGLEDAGFIIAKFYRPNRWSDQAILEEHQFSKELVDVEIPIIAPMLANNNTLHHYNKFRFALFPRQVGRALELNNLDQLECMGRFLGRFHAISHCRPFRHRGRLEVSNQGKNSHDYLMENNFIPHYLREKFSLLATELLKKIEKNFLEVNPVYIRCHGDCHVGNILWYDNALQIVDLDDCLMAPAIQDIWMLLTGDEHQKEIQLDKILRGYSEFNNFNRREIRLIESLRTLRILQYSAWLAKRWEDPAFPLSFPFFNTSHYWENLIQQLYFQMEKMQEEFSY